jgi:hypothetical protein
LCNKYLSSLLLRFASLRREEEEEENDLYQNRTDTNSVKESCTTFILKDLFLFALPFFLPSLPSKEAKKVLPSLPSKEAKEGRGLRREED